MAPENSIYLFYGEDTESLQSTLRQWIERFTLKSDALLDMQQIDVSESNFATIQAALSLMPLLGPKRLVVLRNALQQGKGVQESIAAQLFHIPESVVVVFVEEAPVKETSVLLQTLRNHAMRYFGPPSAQALRARIERHTEKWELKIEPGAVSYLLTVYGSDSNQLFRELDKCALGATGVITEKLVRSLVPAPPESRIFALLDAIFSGDREQAFRLLHDELDYGTAPLQIVALLTTQVRRITLMIDARERGIDNREYPILQNVKPYALSKIAPVSARLDIRLIAAYYLKICEADYALKSGLDPLPAFMPLLSFPSLSAQTRHAR